MGRQRPGTVTNAVRVQAVLVVVSAVGTGLVAVLRDDLVARWAESHGGLEAVRQSQIEPPAFVPVAVVTFVVYALLVWVLATLFGQGHRWARLALGLTALAVIFTMLVIWRADPPLPLVVTGAVVVVLDAVLLWLLASRETGEFVRGAAMAQEHEHIG